MNLLVATSNGSLRNYSIVENSQQITHKILYVEENFSPKPITQISVIAESQLLFSLIDNTIRIHKITHDHRFEYYESLEEMNVSLFACNSKTLTEEQSNCVEHFKNTHKHLTDGSFMVAFPFNMDPFDQTILGESKKMALCRLFQIEKRFKRDPLYKQRYHDEINSYLERNHMSLCKNISNDGYFLPHHAVVRENSTTTKQHTVYDASAKTSNGYSLNDRCYNGPMIQPELYIPCQSVLERH